MGFAAKSRADIYVQRTPRLFAVGRIWLAALLVLGTAGCGALPEIPFSGHKSGETRGALAPQGLPTYEVGDKFTFDDGRTEQVVRVKGEHVGWRNETAFTFTEFRNPVLPRTESNGRVSRTELTELTGVPGALWPLHVGNSTTFSFTFKVFDKATELETEYSQRWSCTVPRTERVSVPAGQFETYRISCYRYSLGGFTYGERVWNFAPSLGHYVRRSDTYFYAREGTVRNLVSAQLSTRGIPEAYKRQMDETIQKALNTLRSGASMSWHSNDGNFAAIVTPIRTYRTKKGYFCREYTDVRTYASRTSPAHMAACKVDGKWRQLT